MKKELTGGHPSLVGISLSETRLVGTGRHHNNSSSSLPVNWNTQTAPSSSDSSPRTPGTQIVAAVTPGVHHRRRPGFLSSLKPLSERGCRNIGFENPNLRLILILRLNAPPLVRPPPKMVTDRSLHLQIEESRFMGCSDEFKAPWLLESEGKTIVGMVTVAKSEGEEEKG
ncbi:hypothetical protein L1987_48417 [Smallanthus sonchifolius]|uniref:Uncharacterized protein n=1 Tax=Smallanthus sonchifolius TaxID=185202 RepID=A0ACB9FSJ1_9ASTR|nr:hypothetical protein L1987_48417 [Smallanthus sonchifolius]